jgi:hypothetical protein
MSITHTHTQTQTHTHTCAYIDMYIYIYINICIYIIGTIFKATSTTNLIKTRSAKIISSVNNLIIF